MLERVSMPKVSPTGLDGQLLFLIAVIWRYFSALEQTHCALVSKQQSDDQSASQSLTRVARETISKLCIGFGYRTVKGKREKKLERQQV